MAPVSRASATRWVGRLVLGLAAVLTSTGIGWLVAPRRGLTIAIIAGIFTGLQFVWAETSSKIDRRLSQSLAFQAVHQVPPVFVTLLFFPQISVWVAVVLACLSGGVILPAMIVSSRWRARRRVLTEQPVPAGGATPGHDQR